MTGRRSMLLTALGATALLTSVAATCGDTTTRVENPNTQQHGISVNGEGKVTGKPDIAMISLGVSALAGSVGEARTQAATSMEAMIATMRSNGIAEKDIQTQQLNISPEYDYSNNRQTLRGFRVANTVSAKLRDIDKTGKVVDDAMSAGGNDTQIQGISFAIDNPDDLRRQAREKAVADARARAQTLAETSGVKLGEPITISETSYQPPIYNARAGIAAADTAAAPQTPIQAGELDVVIDVSVTWSIGS